MKAHLILIMLIFATMLVYAGNEEFVATDGTKLKVEVKGNGFPCLLIIDNNYFSNYWFNRFAKKILEDRFQMVYLTKRSTSDNNFSKTRCLGDIEEVRKYLDIEQWYILNLTYKNCLQNGYLRKYQDKVKGLIFIDFENDFTNMPKYKKLFRFKFFTITYLKLLQKSSESDWIFVY